MPKRPFAEFTRLVPARVDEKLGVDREALNEMVESGLVVPAVKYIKKINASRKEQHAFLKANKKKLSAEDLKLAKPVTAENLKDVYLIPIRWAGSRRSAEYDRGQVRSPGVWGRSEHTKINGRTVIIKGLGVPNIANDVWQAYSALIMPFTEIKSPRKWRDWAKCHTKPESQLGHYLREYNPIDVKSPIYLDPDEELTERQVKGGLRNLNIREVNKWTEKLREE